MTGRRNIDAVAGVAECTPLLIPSLPDAVGIDGLLDVLDGVVLTGGRANVHPRHYGEELSERHGEMDEDRDGVALPLVRACVDAGVPILGLCKGIQEMNVAFGGTLHPEVAELPGRHRHRMPKGCRDPAIVFELRERVRLRPGGVLATMLGTESIVTNSLHGQAILEPGERVVVEGWAADETIEAVSIAGAASFAIGVQWHAEYNPDVDPVGRVLFSRLGDAARDRRNRRRAAAS
jgi:putative glutamine amidotransferase